MDVVGGDDRRLAGHDGGVAECGIGGAILLCHTLLVALRGVRPRRAAPVVVDRAVTRAMLGRCVVVEAPITGAASPIVEVCERVRAVATERVGVVSARGEGERVSQRWALGKWAGGAADSRGAIGHGSHSAALLRALG